MKSSKGITMISLVMTIIVLLILAGITVQIGKTQIANTGDSKLFTDLEMIQHAITQRYTKYKLTKDADLLVGTVVGTGNYGNGKVTWKLSHQEIGDDAEKKYRKIETAEDFKKLGIEKVEDAYIVNYYTGEVYNCTQQETTTGDVLYKSNE